MPERPACTRRRYGGHDHLKHLFGLGELRGEAALVAQARGVPRSRQAFAQTA